MSDITNWEFLAPSLGVFRAAAAGAAKRASQFVASPPLLNFDEAPPSPFLQGMHGIMPRVFFVPAHDGVKLRVAQFEPRHKPLLTLLIVPGQNDPIEYQQRIATMLAGDGARVFVYDPRSQGYSGRTAGLQHIDTCDALDHNRDLKLIIDKVVLPEKAGKFVVAGFSMGALHALFGLAQGDFGTNEDCVIDHAVMLAPAIKPLDIPFHERLAIEWVKKTNRLFRGGKHIRPAPDWDYSRRRPNEKWYATNDYSKVREQLEMVWEYISKDDRLAPGWPTKRRVAHIIQIIEMFGFIPVGTILPPPVSLVLANQDTVIDNTAAISFCNNNTDIREIIRLEERHALDLASEASLGKIAAVITEEPKIRFWSRLRPTKVNHAGRPMALVAAA